MPRMLDAYELNQITMQEDNFHTVLPGCLYRSGQIPAARLGLYIKNFGIKSIINLRSQADCLIHCPREQLIAQANGANVLYAPLRAGSASTKTELLVLLQQFDLVQVPVLIHCSQGINRTGEACALWLLEKEAVSKKEALQQFDAKFGYTFATRSEKYLLVKAWQGRKWLETTYDPILLGSLE